MERVKIEQIATIVRGSSPRPQGDPRYYGGNIPRLMVSDVTRDGMYVTPKLDFLTEDGAKKSRPMLKGDLIIAVSGDPGEPTILNVDACIHDGFVGLRNVDSSKVLIPYLYRFFKYNKLINKAQAVGAIYKNLNTDQIKNLEISLPDLATQKKIAALLDKADELRRYNKQLIEKYDALTKSLFLDMFGDPVKNEKGWEKKLLRDVTLKIGSGSTPKGGKEAYFSEGISLIRSLNIHDNKFKYKDLAFIDNEQAARLKNVIVEENDVLFNITGASVCRCAVVPSQVLPARVNQHVSIIRVNPKKISSIFLTHLLISPIVKTKLYNLATQGGATREAITLEQLKNIEIILPAVHIQNQFAERVQLIEQQKELARQTLQKSEELFNRLLQKAFKGELVPEYEL